MFQANLLKGKRILVTGGGTGLGYSMGHRFLELGAELVICGRRVEVLQEAADKLMAETGGKVEIHGCDIRDAEAVDKMIAAIWENGPLDSLVNNAAGNFISKTEDLSPRAVDAVLNIVLHGSAYATLACGKRWLKEGRKASVLSIVTTYAWTGSAYVVPSAMAKAGVLAMIRSLAVEWGGRGVRLNAIAPGPFPTKGAWERLVPNATLAKKFETNNPLQRVGEHIELANLATFLLSDFAGYINGEVVTIDGGEWLQGAGQFNFLREMSDADWDALKPKKK
jgi:NAD(P)-dependent dehydrogenase (short-subunit alcohol dehydrogenase family)